LIQEHQAGLWRYLRAMGCEAALAEDMVQETFLAVLERASQDRQFAELSPSATTAYLRKIAYNRFVSHLRRAGKLTSLEALDEIAATWNQLAADDQGEAMLAALKICLGELTPRARQALEMRFRDDLSREAIAAALEITGDGAKNLMQRAKQQLKLCVENKIKTNP
jgi:RNA polymerase sigma-70 factor (ECF subfamily)